MAIPVWFWLVFVFAIGCCIGSFLNVVIYRLPREKSLVKPRSFCPSCEHSIPFYYNIPLFSWLILLGKCRYCKAPISPRYFVIEFICGLMYIGLFYFYFLAANPLRPGIGPLEEGWLIYVVHIILLSSLLAASGIDMELWVIPLSICWFATAIGVIGSGAGFYILNPVIIRGFDLLPTANITTATLAAGALIGLLLALLLLKAGFIKPSYVSHEKTKDDIDAFLNPGEAPEEEENFNHRLEMCREVLFLLPIIAGALIFYYVQDNKPEVRDWCVDILARWPALEGILGSLWGYFIGCAVVWATRILGTFAFGKEAMGLGDVHLMGAAGAVIGPWFVGVAFFVAPFFGLTWAIFQMFFRKTRQIPYGPFLSLGVLTVMILHDWFYGYLVNIFNRY